MDENALDIELRLRVSPENEWSRGKLQAPPIVSRTPLVDVRNKPTSRISRSRKSTDVSRNIKVFEDVHDDVDESKASLQSQIPFHTGKENRIECISPALSSSNNSLCPHQPNLSCEKTISISVSNAVDHVSSKDIDTNAIESCELWQNMQTLSSCTSTVSTHVNSQNSLPTQSQPVYMTSSCSQDSRPKVSSVVSEYVQLGISCYEDTFDFKENAKEQAYDLNSSGECSEEFLLVSKLIEDVLESDESETEIAANSSNVMNESSGSSFTLQSTPEKCVNIVNVPIFNDRADTSGICLGGSNDNLFGRSHSLLDFTHVDQADLVFDSTVEMSRYIDDLLQDPADVDLARKISTGPGDLANEMERDRVDLFDNEEKGSNTECYIDGIRDGDELSLNAEELLLIGEEESISNSCLVLENSILNHSSSDNSTGNAKVDSEYEQSIVSEKEQLLLDNEDSVTADSSWLSEECELHSSVLNPSSDESCEEAFHLENVSNQDALNNLLEINEITRQESVFTPSYIEEGSEESIDRSDEEESSASTVVTVEKDVELVNEPITLCGDSVISGDINDVLSKLKDVHGSSNIVSSCEVNENNGNQEGNNTVTEESFDFDQELEELSGAANTSLRLLEETDDRTITEGLRILDELSKSGAHIFSEDGVALESFEKEMSPQVSSVYEGLSRPDLMKIIRHRLRDDPDLCSKRVASVVEALRDACAGGLMPSRISDYSGRLTVSRLMKSSPTVRRIIESLDGGNGVKECEKNASYDPVVVSGAESADTFEVFQDTDDSLKVNKDLQTVQSFVSLKELPVINSQQTFNYQTELRSGRSSFQRQEEIRNLVSQMTEMRQKVLLLESHMAAGQHSGEPSNHKQNVLDPELEEFEIQEQRLSNHFDSWPSGDSEAVEVQVKEQLMTVKNLESLLRTERLKTIRLESHVTTLERKCSLLEKERLSAELNFARELQLFRCGNVKQLDSLELGADIDDEMEVLKDAFDEMGVEVDRMTQHQDLLKNMLNQVMVTANSGLTGYATLLKDYSGLKENMQKSEGCLADAEAEKTRLADDVEELENLLQRTNTTITDLHTLYQDEISSLKDQVSSLTTELEDATKEKQSLCIGLEGNMSQLQESLEKLEAERIVNQEELEDAKFLLEHFKETNRTLQDQLSFLNDEKEVKELDNEESIKTAKEQILALKKHGTELTNTNIEFKKSQDLLQMKVTDLQDQLSKTCNDASDLLALLQEVEGKADDLLDTLRQKFTTEPDDSSCVDQVMAVPGAGQSSFVSRILSAVQQPEDDSHYRNQYRQRSLECPSDPISIDHRHQYASTVSHFHKTSLHLHPTKAPSSRKALDFSSPVPASTSNSNANTSSSLHCLLQHGLSDVSTTQRSIVACQEAGVDKAVTSVAGFAHIRSIPVSEKKSLKYDPSEFSSTDISQQLVESIEKKFILILNLARAAERSSRIKIRDLKAEAELLTGKCNKKQGRIQRMEADMKAKALSLEEAKSEVTGLYQRVSQMTQAILKHEDMGYDLKRLEEDNADLQQDVTTLKGEREMLNNQVQNLIAQGGQDEKANLQRISKLEIQNFQQIRFHQQEQDKLKVKGEKAMKKIRVLEINLQRAEEEVYKFDELVEAIRKTCIDNRSMHTHPVLIHIVRLIDGTIEVTSKAPPGASSSKQSQKPLKQTSSAADGKGKEEKKAEFRV